MSNLFVKQLLRAWLMGEENVNIQELAQKVDQTNGLLRERFSAERCSYHWWRCSNELEQVS